MDGPIFQLKKRLLKHDLSVDQNDSLIKLKSRQSLKYLPIYIQHNKSTEVNTTVSEISN